ncbi:MAG: shikimate kinase [Candidatus Shikimatogenerans sp. AspAUS03]|uniref:Shikimate kinase n=1 Tax=Candidatus Shikimatogenerans sp. AspAUS03 TaxID=3158563 RepID=A0AAU7QSS4_9FLAO
MKISILGYMGVGKTFISKKLSKKINFIFYDLDKYIEKKKNNTINNIFKIYGEKKFRNIETKLLNKILNKSKNIIIALGGGTPCYNNNMKLLNKNTLTIYLNLEKKILYKRLLLIKQTRPLLKIKNKNFKKFIIKHLKKRKKIYNKSLIKIKILNNNYKIVIKQIIKNLKKYVKL